MSYWKVSLIFFVNYEIYINALEIGGTLNSKWPWLLLHWALEECSALLLLLLRFFKMWQCCPLQCGIIMWVTTSLFILPRSTKLLAAHSSAFSRSVLQVWTARWWFLLVPLILVRTRESAKSLLTLKATPANVPLAGKVRWMGTVLCFQCWASWPLLWEGSHPWTLHLSGERCTVDIDECVSKPCKNHALCHNIQGSYLCECRPGFTGGDCDSNIDDCLSSGYQHFAQCFPVFPKNKFADCCLTDS